MKKLPRSTTYEKEFKYMPWGMVIGEVLNYVSKEVPRGGSLLDLMCGPGYLLSKISEDRVDLDLEGFDIESEFITHAKKMYPKIKFWVADALVYEPKKRYDVVLCTGSLHHLPYDRQEEFLRKVSKSMNKGGFAMFAEPYIDEFSNEKERKLAAAKLGYEYMAASIKKDAPSEIVEATLDILFNDVMGFEYKTSIKKIEPILNKIFTDVMRVKTWPEYESEYGDYYFVCKL